MLLMHVLFLGSLVAFALLPFGCATTEQGIQREHAIYQAATNIVAEVPRVTPCLPAPGRSGARAHYSIPA